VHEVIGVEENEGRHGERVLEHRKCRKRRAEKVIIDLSSFSAMPSLLRLQGKVILRYTTRKP
jgi:hypothetical protein